MGFVNRHVRDSLFTGLGVMSKLLSVCIIAKNEEESIASALACVSESADEVIVGDTGSTDRTAEIASDMGATVVSVPWDDNFAAARNAVKAVASGEWILSLDADEVVPKSDLFILKKSLEGAAMKKFSAYILEKRSYVTCTDPQYQLQLCTGEYPDMEREYPAFIAEPNLLLFRNDPNIQWSGAVHESISRSLESTTAHGLLSWLPIHNYGRERNKEQKLVYYRKLVAKRLVEDPLDPMSWFYHGLMLESSGSADESERSYRKSLKIQKTTYCLYALALCLMRQGKTKQAEISMVEYLRFVPEDPNAWMTLLVCAMTREDMDCMDYYLGTALKTNTKRKADLVRFAQYSANKNSYPAKAEMYEKLLKKLPIHDQP